MEHRNNKGIEPLRLALDHWSMLDAGPQNFVPVVVG
jgi:hypothetical protein